MFKTDNCLLITDKEMEFVLYLELGYEHILDIKAYDHILFVLSLCAMYQLKDWKKLLILVSAFTIGHSLTLALTSLKMIIISSQLVEFLIPITIIISCIFNFFEKENNFLNKAKYILILLFGFIHGMGFANYLQALLGDEESILMPILSFNVGLEFGQILIVFFTLLFSELLIRYLKVPKYEWNLVFSSIIIGLSISLVNQNWIF